MSKKKIRRDGETRFANTVKVPKATPVVREVVDAQLGTNRDTKMAASRARIDGRRKQVK